MTFAETIMLQKYAHDLPQGRKETWDDIAMRVASEVVKPILPGYAQDVYEAIRDKKLMPAGRYLNATGRPFHQVNNCMLFRAEDSREGWASLMQRVTSSLMTGAGIGVMYSDLRPNGSPIRGLGGQSTGPIALMQMVNEAGRFVMQGGSRRSAIWAGLHWNHGDIEQFITLKDWSPEIVALKANNFNAAAPMDMTNISVILDDGFFAAYHDPAHPEHSLAVDVYNEVVRHMLETGEPGFSVDVGENAGESLRNACTEITSADDNDVCNLGSINMGRVDNLHEMINLTELGTALLLCGSIYSKVPFPEVEATREKNRRLGLGLMGVHEFMAKRGIKYGRANDELLKYLDVYKYVSDTSARDLSGLLSVSAPVKVRAVAPTGTISILAETTSGIEPIFCPAFKRRYLKGSQWHAQYLVDASAKRLEAQGVDPDSLDTAYGLAESLEGVERRVAMQAIVQEFVDHGISSTINLPAWGTEHNNEGKVKAFGYMLIKYLPLLRGITTYPDQARGGQPLTQVDYAFAKDFEGVEVVEYGNENACKDGVCGV